MSPKILRLNARVKAKSPALKPCNSARGGLAFGNRFWVCLIYSGARMPRMRISNVFLSVWELCYTTVTVHQIRSKRGRRLQFNSLNTAMLANAGEFAQNFDVGICWVVWLWISGSMQHPHLCIANLDSLKTCLPRSFRAALLVRVSWCPTKAAATFGSEFWHAHQKKLRPAMSSIDKSFRAVAATEPYTCLPPICTNLNFDVGHAGFSPRCVIIYTERWIQIEP